MTWKNGGGDGIRTREDNPTRTLLRATVKFEMRFPTKPLLAGSVHPQRPLTILKWLSRYYPGRCANLFPVGLPTSPNTPTPSYPGFAKCRFWLEPANQPYAPNLSPACWVPDAAQPCRAVARTERSKSGTHLSILAGDQRSFLF